MSKLELNQIIQGNTLEVLKTFPDDFVDTIITSPPYWGLRDYGVEGQIGLERTLDEFLDKLLAITAELKRVLKPTGVMFWDHGDCYSSAPSGSLTSTEGEDGVFKRRLERQGQVKKPKTSIPTKSLCLQNYRLILKMIDDRGWILRNSVIWHKPNTMPSSVKDRFSNSYEPVFMLVKQQRYFFDLDAVRKPLAPSTLRDIRSGCKSARANSKATEKIRQGMHGSGGIGDPTKTRAELHNPAGKNPSDLWTIPTQPFPFDWCPKCQVEVTAIQRGAGFIHKKCGTEVVGHFATFPEALVEPMILSSCPQWICKKCGKARVRITKTSYYPRNPNPEKSHNQPRANVEIESRQERGFNPRPQGMRFGEADAKRQTIGWTDCGCKAGWEAGIVLDPFMGSGTVAMVAKKLGRNYIGIELKPEYIKMSEKRLLKVSEPLPL